jgi:hypothetical protein
MQSGSWDAVFGFTAVMWQIENPRCPAKSVNGERGICWMETPARAASVAGRPEGEDRVIDDDSDLLA